MDVGLYLYVLYTIELFSKRKWIEIIESMNSSQRLFVKQR